MRQSFKTQDKQTKQLSNLNRLPKAVYPMRILGMGMAAIAIGSALIELQANTLTWSWLIISCILWPHIAYGMTQLTGQPYKTEKVNLLIDSFIAGSLVPLMGFNLLPSVLLILLNVTDKVNTAIKGWWIYSLIVSILSILLISLIFNVPWQPKTSHFVILGCLPLIIIHFTVVSFTAHRLINRVQSQNRLLNKLGQQDDLTALFNRRTWQQKTQALLDKHTQDKAGPLTLLLIDIDQFKTINDDFGHAIGDDILVSVATIVKESCPQDSIIGRLGGDEFIVVTPHDLPAATGLAETINKQVNLIHTVADNVHSSVSIGLATIKSPIKDIRTWFEAADKALYEAKKKGRNTLVGSYLN